MSANIVMAMYRPKEGMSDKVIEIIREHHGVLDSQNLVTDRRPLVLRAGDGSFIEIFEWISESVVGEAHKNPVVAAIWNRFEEVCEYGILNKLPNSGDVFPHFELIDV